MGSTAHVVVLDGNDEHLDWAQQRGRTARGALEPFPRRQRRRAVHPRRGRAPHAGRARDLRARRACDRRVARHGRSLRPDGAPRARGRGLRRHVHRRARTAAGPHRRAQRAAGPRGHRRAGRRPAARSRRAGTGLRGHRARRRALHGRAPRGRRTRPRRHRQGRGGRPHRRGHRRPRREWRVRVHGRRRPRRRRDSGRRALADPGRGPVRQPPGARPHAAHGPAARRRDRHEHAAHPPLGARRCAPAPPDRPRHRSPGGPGCGRGVVQAPTAWWAESLAKAALVAGVHEGLDLLARHGVAGWVVDDDGRVWATGAADHLDGGRVDEGLGALR